MFPCSMKDNGDVNSRASKIKGRQKGFSRRNPYASPPHSGQRAMYRAWDRASWHKRIRSLEPEGIVERRRSAGTFVAAPKMHFNKLMSYTEQMSRLRTGAALARILRIRQLIYAPRVRQPFTRRLPACAFGASL